MKRVGVILITAALIVGLAGCPSAPQYSLTIVSTAGGSVTTPGEGAFTYPDGAVVNLVATPDSGYLFANWTGDVGTIADVNAAITTIIMQGDYAVVANFGQQLELEGTPMVAAGASHVVGVKSDGSVVAVGLNDDGQCDVGGWTDIVQVSAGGDHTVGLKSDRTVIAVGDNWWGQCDVGGWVDIVQVAAVGDHTLGLDSDCTAVAVGPEGGWYDYGQCCVGGLTDMVQVAAGECHTTRGAQVRRHRGGGRTGGGAGQTEPARGNAVARESVVNSGSIPAVVAELTTIRRR